MRVAVALLLLLSITASAKPKKPKPPKTRGCLGTMCLEDVSLYEDHMDFIRGVLTNNSKASLAGVSLNFKILSRGTITGSAVVVSPNEIGTGERWAFAARVFQTYENYDYTIETCEFRACSGGDCGSLVVKLSPPLFAAGARSERKAWEKANGY